MQKNVCVFCSSNEGLEKKYDDLAVRVGLLLVEYSFTLVFGGTRIGLMGVLAATVKEQGGTVIGVVPLQYQSKKFPQLDQCLIASDLGERKQLMAQHADAFLVLPGGTGTLDETLSVIEMKKTGEHKQKPLIIINFERFFSSFISQLRRLEREGFSGTPLFKVARNEKSALWHIEQCLN